MATPDDIITYDDIETELHDAVIAYLKSTHSGQWGRSYSIHNDEGRERAAQFILDTMRGVARARHPSTYEVPA